MGPEAEKEKNNLFTLDLGGLMGNYWWRNYTKVIDMFDEELDPRTKKPVKKDLTLMSIEELEQYIDDMKQEITRVEEEIKRKEAHRDAAAASFFKKESG